MQIDISQLIGKKESVLPIELSINVENLDCYPDVVDFLKPVDIKGTLCNKDNKIVLDASGEALVHVACGRCLKLVELKIFFDLNEEFSNTGSEEQGNRVFEGHTIDFLPIIQENLNFRLPMKVVCSDDCKGICPKCGKNLNEGDCKCDMSCINPKFENLRSLFKVDEEV